MFSPESTVSWMPEVWPHRNEVSGEASSKTEGGESKTRWKKRERKPSGFHSFEETVTMAEPVDKTAWLMFTVVDS